MTVVAHRWTSPLSSPVGGIAANTASGVRNMAWASNKRCYSRLPMAKSSSDKERTPASARYLSRAPIAEALVDFHAQLPESVSIADFRQIAEAEKGRYPNGGVIREISATLKLTTEAHDQDVKRDDIGVRIETADRKTVAQFRINGFTLNRLAPYTKWSEIYPEAIRLWKLYVVVAKPSIVPRLATRYVNRLRLPGPVVELGDYLTSPPVVPTGLPQALQSFLTRLVIHDSEIGHSAIITQGYEPDLEHPESVSVLLDIDAFRMAEVRSDDFAAIDGIFDRLHDFKNNIFFGSITEKAARLFE